MAAVDYSTQEEWPRWGMVSGCAVAHAIGQGQFGDEFIISNDTYLRAYVAHPSSAHAEPAPGDRLITTGENLR